MQSQQVMSNSVSSTYPMDIYDTIVIPAAGFSEISLFTQIQGQSQTAFDGAGAGGKTWWDTNMTVSGMLPSGKSIQVYGMSFLYEAGSSPNTPLGFKGALPIQSINDTSPTATGVNIPLPAAEVYRALRNLHAQLVIGDKVICEGRLFRFPMPTDCRIDSAMASTGTGIRSSANCVTEGDVWDFRGNGLQIDPTVGFSVRIKSPSVTPTLTTFNARLTCYLLAKVTSAAQ